MFSKIFLLRPLKIWRGKLQIYFKGRHQSEARNFETTQHIDKLITGVSSTINALQNFIKLWGHHPTGFSCNPGRELVNYKWCAKIACFVQ